MFKMSRRTRTAVVGAALIAVVALILPAPAAAVAAPAARPHGGVSVSVELVATSDLGPAYVAGSSVAAYPVYDTFTWSKIYKCTYAGWAHVQVNFQCRLQNPFTGTTYTGFSGSFSGGSYNPSARSFRTADTYLCTYASAAYNDGSDGDTDTKGA